MIKGQKKLKKIKKKSAMSKINKKKLAILFTLMPNYLISMVKRIFYEYPTLTLTSYFYKKIRIINFNSITSIANSSNLQGFIIKSIPLSLANTFITKVLLHLQFQFPIHYHLTVLFNSLTLLFSSANLDNFKIHSRAFIKI